VLVINCLENGVNNKFLIFYTKVIRLYMHDMLINKLLFYIIKCIFFSFFYNSKINNNYVESNQFKNILTDQLSKLIL